jgi:hypothetical protein
MLFAILCYDSEAAVGAWTQEHDDQVMQQLGAVTAKLAAQKRLGPVARLMDTPTARTLRKGTKATVIDGPFAETKEQLLGFYVVECESMEHALETAKELAAASGSAGAFEIRPLRFYSPSRLPDPT